jgi:diguanylate cyclase (GGDEF)-like protein
LPQTALDGGKLREIINTQTEVVRLGLDLGSVMNLVALRAPELTGADGAVIELAEGEHMVYRACSGIASGQLGLRLNRSGSLSGLCVADDRALYCEDSDADSRVDRAACQRVGLRSMVVSPLRHGSTVVGVLKVLAKEPRAFNTGTLEALDLLSGLVAASMYHAGQLEASELFRRATHDPLTGLANRALFFERLRHEIECARRASRAFAVLNLDMDGLKPINDNHGHRAGDAAICAVAARVRSGSRSADTVARMGGDEFAVLLSSAGHDDAQQLRHRLEESIRAPFEFDQKEFALSASIGSAVFPEDGTEPDVLLEAADRSMYSSKRSRRGGPAVSATA